VIGEKVDLTYSYNHLGAGPESLAELVKNHSAISKKKPMVIVGHGALAREDGAGILSMAAKFAAQIGAVRGDWNGFGVLHTAASRVGALDLGFVPGSGGLDAQAMMAGGVDVLFNLAADERDIASGPFVIYQGTHGDRGAERADVILPGAAYTEKSATYVNTEGRVQMTARAVFAPGEAKEDWAILRALSARIGQTLPYDTLGQLRQALYAAHPHFAGLDQAAAGDPAGLAKLAKAGGRTAKAAFAGVIADFYLTNPVARASAIMAECSQLQRSRTMQAAE
jgi:NADH-quinone oxidoreductase subunit G